MFTQCESTAVWRKISCFARYRVGEPRAVNSGRARGRPKMSWMDTSWSLTIKNVKKKMEDGLESRRIQYPVQYSFIKKMTKRTSDKRNNKHE